MPVPDFGHLPNSEDFDRFGFHAVDGDIRSDGGLFRRPSGKFRPAALEKRATASAILSYKYRLPGIGLRDGFAHSLLNAGVRSPVSIFAGLFLRHSTDPPLLAGSAGPVKP